MRLGLTGPWTGNALAFKNPDNSIVLIIANPFKDERILHFQDSETTYQFALKPESFNTIIQFETHG